MTICVECTEYLNGHEIIEYVNKCDKCALKERNEVMGGVSPQLADARLNASEMQGSVACIMEVSPPATMEVEK